MVTLADFCSPPTPATRTISLSQEQGKSPLLLSLKPTAVLPLSAAIQDLPLFSLLRQTLSTDSGSSTVFSADLSICSSNYCICFTVVNRPSPPGHGTERQNLVCAETLANSLLFSLTEKDQDAHAYQNVMVGGASQNAEPGRCPRFGQR